MHNIDAITKDDSEEEIPEKRRHLSDGAVTSQSDTNTQELSSQTEEQEEEEEAEDEESSDESDTDDEDDEDDEDGDETNAEIFSNALREAINDTMATFRERLPHLNLNIQLREVQETDSSNSSAPNRRRQFRFDMSLGPNDAAPEESNEMGEVFVRNLEQEVGDVLATIRSERHSMPSTSEAGTSTEGGASGSQQPGRCYVRCGFSENDQTFVLPNSSWLSRKRKRDAPLNIHYNLPRLTHYIHEANVGTGYIKEFSFSHDGRVIASPFGFGVRLLAFDPHCSDMNDCRVSSVTRLCEVTSRMNHKNVVLAAKFSPVHNLLVTGCLQGKVAFHQPVF